MKRVIVIGSSCSGKTTLARHLAEILGFEQIELDALHWGPDWSMPATGSFRSAVEERICGDYWVVDGNYSVVRDIVWSKATDAIWLNYPFYIVFSRAVVRTMKRIISREVLYNGNRESFRRAFLSRGSILLWIIRTFRRRRKGYRALFAADVFPNLCLIELRRPRDARRLLASLRRGTEGSSGG